MTVSSFALTSFLIFGSAAVTGCGSGGSDSSDSGGDGDGDGAGSGGQSGTGANSSGSATSAGGSVIGGGGTTNSGGNLNIGGATSDGGANAGAGGSEAGGGNDGAVGEGACFDGTCAGVCEGTTCGGEWTCDTLPRPCNGDIATYCGCDGVAFQDSGSCPSQAFSHRGVCEAEVGASNCNAAVTCRRAQPECDFPNTTPEVVDGCWGECVPVDSCACESDDDCPDPQGTDQIICYTGEGKCGPPLR